MRNTVAIRSEDKSKWERRTPIIPEHVKEFIEKYDMKICVQSSKIRVFSDDEYRQVGANVLEKIDKSNIIFGIKEIPPNLIHKQKTYIFFSHTIKGQKHNMPMLREIISGKSTLIDYEKIVDEKGKRKIFFGKYAGIAGMIDTFHIFGKRLLTNENIDTPFSEIQPTYRYGEIGNLEHEIKKLGKVIGEQGLPETITPFVIGIAGYGNVSIGAQWVLKHLPTIEIKPHSFFDFVKSKDYDDRHIYKVVFHEEDMVEPINNQMKFDLNEYYNHPEKYQSVFERYIPYLHILINAIYWDNRYPRLVTKRYLSHAYQKYNVGTEFRLRVIGDISCDINGAIECTEYATNQDMPSFVYDPVTNNITEGLIGRGIAIMSIDNLPCELPKDSSIEFSNALKSYVPEIANTDLSVDFENCTLSDDIKNAVIVYNGKLTPKYEYLKKYVF